MSHVCAHVYTYTHPFLYRNNKIKSNKMQRKTCVHVRNDLHSNRWSCENSKHLNLGVIFLIFNELDTTTFFLIVDQRMRKLAMNWTSDMTVPYIAQILGRVCKMRTLIAQIYAENHKFSIWSYAFGERSNWWYVKCDFYCECARNCARFKHFWQCKCGSKKRAWIVFVFRSVRSCVFFFVHFLTMFYTFKWIRRALFKWWFEIRNLLSGEKNQLLP